MTELLCDRPRTTTSNPTIVDMHQRWRAVDLAAALRWLGAPLTVLCLVVMALNDHVLKQAWPGLVTGKLSDVTGLVVAPPLLAVGLMMLRVPWSAAVALTATTLGFILTKSTEIGSEAASAVWSWFGYPTYIRRDLTDLVALPAILLAAREWMVTREPAEPRRRRVNLAVGAMVLPFVVVATAATSCDPRGDGVAAVTVVTGDFAGGPVIRESLLVVDTDESWVAIEPSGVIRDLADADVSRLESVPSGTTDVCDPANRLMCWRVGESEHPSVESTSDGGRTWQLDYEMSEQEVERLVEDLGERCGDPPRVGLRDLAVLGTPDGPIVAAATLQAGLLLRMPGESWRRISPEELLSDAEDARPGNPRGELDVQDSHDPDHHEPSPPSDPVPPCPSPLATTITPDPRNGPPFVTESCPDGSYSSPGPED